MGNKHLFTNILIIVVTRDWIKLMFILFFRRNDPVSDQRVYFRKDASY